MVYMSSTHENVIINVEPDINYITFQRPDGVYVTIYPSHHRNCVEMEYSNHPNARPTLISLDSLAPFLARNPHIAAHVANMPAITLVQPA